MATTSKKGRMPGTITYIDVIYNNKDYVVGTIKHNGSDVQFLFDYEDYDKVSERAWHVSSGKYIGSTFYTKGEVNNKKELYLHNLVMNRLEWYGKGTTTSVDHINRNGFDNRKENLRLLTQSEQNFNQTKRSRTITLPEGCDINTDEIPRHIWYIKANGAHGDRFAIEFKSENIVWKSSSSKKISLKDKLLEAKVKLEELYVLFPHLNPFDPEKIQREESLTSSFNDIMKLAVNI